MRERMARFSRQCLTLALMLIEEPIGITSTEEAEMPSLSHMSLRERSHSSLS